MDEDLQEFCPAVRNFGKLCLYPKIRGVFLSGGGKCCSAGLCNVAASFPAPHLHIPSEERVREVSRRFALPCSQEIRT